MGTLAVVPDHLVADLQAVLEPLAEAAGLACRRRHRLVDPADPAGPAGSGREPDLVLLGPVGVELVVEVATAGEDPLEGLPLYARLGVPEVLLVDPEAGTINLRRLRPDGEHRCQLCGVDGGLRLRAVPLRLVPVDGALLATWPDGERLVALSP